MSLARPGLRADDLGQKGFRRGVTVQDVVLASFLVVDDELDADPRVTRPAWVRRMLAIADEIAGVGFGHGAHDPRYVA